MRGGIRTGAAVIAAAVALLAPSAASALNPVSFSPTGSLAVPREYPGAATLPDGRVLVAGGYDGSNSLQSTEIFNPATGRFSPGASTDDHTKLLRPAAASLPDGRVLIAGGYNGDLVPRHPDRESLQSCRRGRFPLVGSMVKPTELAAPALRFFPTVRILIVGGYSNAAGSINEHRDLQSPPPTPSPPVPRIP